MSADVVVATAAGALDGLGGPPVGPHHGLGPPCILPPEGDERIRARLEACKQGMMQLDMLRNRHQRLMDDMRVRLPQIPGCDTVKSRVKRQMDEEIMGNRESVQSDVSNLSSVSTHMKEDSRCDSPFSGCVSHRSSVSIDSGCMSMTSASEISSVVQPPTLTYGAFRKLSIEDRKLPSTLPHAHRRQHSDRVQSERIHETVVEEETQRKRAAVEDFQIVATTIESTTALRPRSVKNGRAPIPRPRSMYATPECREDRHAEYAEIKKSRASSPPSPRPFFDACSFSAITPPPIHRKFGVAGVKLQLSPPSPRTPLSPIRFSVNKSPPVPPRHTLGIVHNAINILNGNGGNVPSGGKVPVPQVRKEGVKQLRTAQKPDQSPKPTRSDSTVFHAARVFVDRSPNMRRIRGERTHGGERVRPQSMYETQREAETVFCAQPARVLSRQPSYATPSGSPSEIRKLTVAAGIAKFEAHAQGLHGKREKNWHESEAL